MKLLITKEKSKILLISFILFLFVALPNILYCFYLPEVAEKGIFNIFLFLALFLSVYLLPFSFLSFRLSFLLFYPLLLLSFVEFYHISIFDTPLNISSLTTILATNKNEAIELLSSLSVWFIVILLFSVFYFFLSFNKSLNYKFNTKTRKIILFFSLTITFLNFSYNFFYHLGKGYFFKSDVENTLYTFSMKYKKIYPFRIIEMYHHIKDVKKYEEMTVDYQFRVTSDEEDSPIYILVIGESSRYENWQINGYERETSPYLMSLNNLHTFSDCYSSSNTTVMSVPFIYIRGNPSNQERIYQEKSFVSFYKELNYKTFLINNQILYNEGVLLRIKNEFDEYYDIFDSKKDNNVYDSNVFPTLDSIVKNDIDKKLIIIHLMGSHFKYNARYPIEFEKYTPCKTNKSDIQKKRQIFSRASSLHKKYRQLYLNEYDNSILYNDYILGSIISKADSLNKKAVVMFVSDHGQNLFDASDNMLHGSPLPYKSEFHVPFFMWFSDEYITDNRDKVENAIKNKDKRLTSENIFYTLINLSDVNFESNDLSKSIISDDFQQDSVRKVLCPSGIYDFN